MNELKNKKVLLIAPKYFDYEKDICIELEKKGADVVYIRENDDYGVSFARIINKYEGVYERYILNKIEKYRNNDFDYIFCIRINSFTIPILKKIKSWFKYAEIIIYYWDSVKNMKNAVNNASFADRVYSFDRMDCDIYGWNFRPLFYTDVYKNMKRCERDESKKSVFMVASLSPKRDLLTKEMVKLFKENDIEYDIILYMNRMLFYKRRFINKEYKNIDHKNLSFHKMPISDIIDKLKHCDVVLDICHSTQTGMTIRSVEAFGAGKRLITTNKDFVNYDIYDKKSVLIYDGDNNDLLKFINSDVEIEVDDKLYYKYSISGWIDEIFQLYGE